MTNELVKESILDKLALKSLLGIDFKECLEDETKCIFGRIPMVSGLFIHGSTETVGDKFIFLEDCDTKKGICNTITFGDMHGTSSISKKTKPADVEKILKNCTWLDFGEAKYSLFASTPGRFIETLLKH